MLGFTSDLEVSISLISATVGSEIQKSADHFEIGKTHPT